MTIDNVIDIASKALYLIIKSFPLMTSHAVILIFHKLLKKKQEEIMKKSLHPLNPYEKNVI